MMAGRSIWTLGYNVILSPLFHFDGSKTGVLLAVDWASRTGAQLHPLLEMFVVGENAPVCLCTVAA